MKMKVGVIQRTVERDAKKGTTDYTRNTTWLCGVVVATVHHQCASMCKAAAAVVRQTELYSSRSQRLKSFLRVLLRGPMINLLYI